MTLLRLSKLLAIELPSIRKYSAGYSIFLRMQGIQPLFLSGGTVCTQFKACVLPTLHSRPPYAMNVIQHWQPIWPAVLCRQSLPRRQGTHPAHPPGSVFFPVLLLPFLAAFRLQCLDCLMASVLIVLLSIAYGNKFLILCPCPDIDTANVVSVVLISAVGTVEDFSVKVLPVQVPTDRTGLAGERRFHF